MANTRLTTEEAAARVGAVLWENRGRTLDVDTLAAKAGLTVRQVRKAEQFLKGFVNEHRKEFEGYALYVALGGESAHGFLQDDRVFHEDVLRRVKYCVQRGKSELAYREQAAARVQDPTLRRHLRRGVEYSRVAVQAFEDAYEALGGDAKR